MSRPDGWKIVWALILCGSLFAGCDKSGGADAGDGSGTGTENESTDQPNTTDTSGSVKNEISSLAGKVVIDGSSTVFTNWGLSLSDDGKYLAAASGKSASIWDTGTARRIQQLFGHSQVVYSVALSATGKLAVTGSADRTAILWDVGTGEKLKSFVGHADSVKSVGISSDGKYVVTSSDGDGTAIL